MKINLIIQRNTRRCMRRPLNTNLGEFDRNDSNFSVFQESYVISLISDIVVAQDVHISRVPVSSDIVVLAGIKTETSMSGVLQLTADVVIVKGVFATVSVASDLVIVTEVDTETVPERFPY